MPEAPPLSQEETTAREQSAATIEQLRASNALGNFAADLLRIRDAQIAELQLEIARLNARLNTNAAALTNLQRLNAEMSAGIAELLAERAAALGIDG